MAENTPTAQEIETLRKMQHDCEAVAAQMRQGAPGSEATKLFEADAAALKSALAALTAAPAGHARRERHGMTQDWQPIETAPRDGTEVLLCRYRNGHYEAIEHGSWGFIEISGWDGASVYDWTTDFGNIEEPTHWMSKLPPPGETAPPRTQDRRADMHGARDYAALFSSGQHGRLYLVRGSHARGSTFHIWVLPIAESVAGMPWSVRDAVEVYGIVGGSPGWTEHYGWLHRGPWQQDFAALVEARRSEIAASAVRREREHAAAEAAEKQRVASLLASYAPSDPGATR